MKRGQAAMEFLMTYGWAILAVLITIGALAYFGVLSPALFLPEVCILFPGVACTDFSINQNSIILEVQNGIGTNLDDFQITIPSLGCSSNLIPLRVGEKMTITLTGCTISSSQLREDLNIFYTSANLNHVRQGKLIGQVVQGVMTLYYSFDSGTVSAGIVSDMSGNALDGTIIGSLDCSVPGESGNGCHFDGNSRILISTNPNLDTNTITIQTWIKLDEIPTSDEMALINLKGGPGTDVGIWIFIDISGTSSPLRFMVKASGVEDSFTSNTELEKDRWYHIKAVYDGTNMDLYIDGILDSNSRSHSDGGDIDFDSLVPALDIGSQGGTLKFKGTMDELIIHDYPL